MRVRLGALRSLIREVADPFAERPTLAHGIDVLGRLEEAGVDDLPALFKRISSSARSPRSRQAMSRAAGVATHMVHDFKALQALVMVALQDEKRS